MTLYLIGGGVVLWALGAWLAFWMRGPVEDDPVLAQALEMARLRAGARWQRMARLRASGDQSVAAEPGEGEV